MGQKIKALSFKITTLPPPYLTTTLIRISNNELTSYGKIKNTYLA